jgi:hypothetical protein
VRKEPDLPEVMPADEPVDAISEVLPADGEPNQPNDPAEASAGEALWWQGNFIDRLSAQKGVIVLRSKFVAFLPTEKAKNLVGTLAGGLASAASPIQTISLDWLQRRPNPLQMVNDLWSERRDNFDRCLFEIVEHLGGFVWARSVVQVARPDKGSTGRSEALMIVRQQAELRGSAPAGPELDRLLSEWQETAPSARGDVIGLLVVSVLPLLLAAALFVGSLLTHDIPRWAPLIGVGLAVLLWLLAALKAVLVRRQAKRTPAATTTGDDE